MPVLEAVERDIAQLPGDLSGSALAAVAMSLAAEMDSGRNGATSKSMCAKALGDVLAQLRALAPDEKGGDRLDDLAERRAARLAG